MTAPIVIGKKIINERFQGLGYDLTIRFNLIKEKKSGSVFKKQRQRIDNIVIPVIEPLMMLDTYVIEENIEQLHKISKQRFFKENKSIYKYK